MSQETIDEERREQKIYQDLVNLSEGDSNEDLYKEMDTLREDLEHDGNSEFFRKQEDIDNDSNDEVPANSEEPLMNAVPSEEHDDDTAQESDAQSRSIENPEPCDEKQSDKGFLTKNWLLVAGLVLVAFGMFGVIGLRLNIVQVFLLNIDNPFPGIGSIEPFGHIGSIIPFAIGIVAIFVWGFRSEKGGAVEKSDGEDNSAKKIVPVILEPKGRDMCGFEYLSPHKYA